MDAEGCSQGHRPSFQIPTQPGARFCIMCFVKVLANPSVFLTHKLYAVSELREALQDPAFSADFFHLHRFLVVPPVCEAIGAVHDTALAEALIHLVLDICGINAISVIQNPSPLLEDFTLHIVLHLSSSSGLSSGAGESYTLHLLGILLDDYCKLNNILPEAVKGHHGFLPNLIAGLKLPGDHLQGEILFLLYKICLFEDGVVVVLPFISDLVHAALLALIKSESNELRMNCIALLTILAQKSVVNIRFQQEIGTTPLPDNAFARKFGESIKGSMISSDPQIQEAALQLIYYMCPQESTLGSDLHILIDEGILDYVFEVLRICEGTENIVIWSIRVLTILCGARESFVKKFALGIETMNRVLDLTIRMSICAVQPDTLFVIVAGLTGCPGTISTANAKHLLQMLTAILTKYAGDNYGLQHDVFSLTCSAIGALLNLPCVSGIGDVNCELETAVSSAFITLSASTFMSVEEQSLKHAILLLKESFSFLLRVQSLTEPPITDVLIEICEVILVPIIANNFLFIEDEDIVCTALSTFHFVIENLVSGGSTKIAKILATNSWFSLSYELMARFPTEKMKNASMNLLCSIVCCLETDITNNDVKAQFAQLPSDPEALLVLLTRNSMNDPQLKVTQFAIISILYTSQSYGERFAESIHMLACMEQYLLTNSSVLLQDSLFPCIIKQLLCIYVLTMDSCKMECSLEAENTLIALIQQCQSDILSSKIPITVIKWILQKQSMEEYMLGVILKWLKYSADRKGENGEKCQLRSNENEGNMYEDLTFLLTLLEEDQLCSILFNRLLDEVLAKHSEEDIRIVIDCYTVFARKSVLAANQLCLGGIISTIRSWLAIHCSKPPEYFTYMIELLYQLLCALNCDDALDEESWLFLASQFAYILGEKLNECSSINMEEENVVLLSILSMILHKSEDNEGFLAPSAEAILSNHQLQSATIRLLERAANKGSIVSNLELESQDGKFWCSTITFHLFCLRCAIVMHASTLQGSNWTGTNSQRNSLVLPKTHKDIGYLCRLLHFGPPFLKVLSSSCLAEACYWLNQVSVDDEREGNIAEQNRLESLMSMMMILQEPMFGSSDIVRINCSSSLYFLITNVNLTPQETALVQKRTWLHFLVEELMLTLSTPGELVPCTVLVAVGLLKANTSSKWVFAILSSFCIEAIVSCITPKRITLAMMAFLKELHSKGCLQDIHREKIRGILQATRSTIYEEICRVDSSDFDNDQRHVACFLDCKKDSDSECLRSHIHILHLAAFYLLNPLSGTRHYLADDHCSIGLVQQIDEFLQETL